MVNGEPSQILRLSHRERNNTVLSRCLNSVERCRQTWRTTKRMVYVSLGAHSLRVGCWSDFRFLPGVANTLGRLRIMEEWQDLMRIQMWYTRAVTPWTFAFPAFQSIPCLVQWSPRLTVSILSLSHIASLYDITPLTSFLATHIYQNARV